MIILIKLQKLDQALQALHTCLRAGIVEEKPVEKTKENDKKSLRIKHGFAKAHLDIGDLLQNKNNRSPTTRRRDLCPPKGLSKLINKTLIACSITELKGSR